MASNQIILNKLASTATLLDLVAPATTYNGYILIPSSKNSDGTFDAAAPAAVTDRGMVMVIEDPLSYEVEHTENDFVIATGAIIRSVIPYVGFTVSIPVANVTATAALAVDKVVVPVAANAKPECLAAPAGTEKIVFNIDKLYTKAGVSMVELRCIQAE